MSRRELTFITGTGRSGTSILVTFLTELGFETEPRKGSRLIYNSRVRGGLEYTIEAGSRDLQTKIDQAPEIIKDPRLCLRLDALIELDLFDVYMVIVPVRDLVQASRSRVHYRIDWQPNEDPVLGADVPDLGMFEGQLVYNQRALGFLMQTIALRDLPHLILDFPRFALDPEYLFEKLKNTKYAVSWEPFKRAHAKVFKPSVIVDHK